MTRVELHGRLVLERHPQAPADWIRAVVSLCSPGTANLVVDCRGTDGISVDGLSRADLLALQQTVKECLAKMAKGGAV